MVDSLLIQRRIPAESGGCTRPIVHPPPYFPLRTQWSSLFQVQKSYQSISTAIFELPYLNMTILVFQAKLCDYFYTFFFHLCNSCHSTFVYSVTIEAAMTEFGERH